MYTAVISDLAALSRLCLTQEEQESLSHELTAVIELMDTIQDIDGECQEFTEEQIACLPDLRDDTPMESYPSEKILKNAKHEQGCFVIPKVIET